jgi:tetratricopeptide (TPR) repeat protein
MNAAITAYKKSAAVSTTASTLERLGTAYQKTQQADAAVTVLRQAVQLAPRDSSAHCRLGLSLLDAGQVSAAEEQLARAVQLNQHNGVAYLALSGVAAQKGQPALATRYLELAVQNGAATADAHLRMARIFLTHGDRRAESELRKALSLDESLAPAHLRLACLILQRNPKEAEEHFQEALLGDLSGSDRARAYVGMALIAQHSGAPDEAAAYLQQATFQQPDSQVQADIAFGMGVMHRQAGHVGQAYQDFRSAAAVRPQNPVMREGTLIGRLDLVGSAFTYERDGRFSEAQACLQTLISGDPGNSEYRLRLAGLLILRHDLTGAIAQLRLALIQSPQDPELWLRLANALYQQGNFQQSSRSISQALQYQPLWPQIRPDVDMLMGKVQLACNHPQLAQTYLQYAAAMRSPLVDPNECLSLLQTADERVHQGSTQPANVPAQPAGPSKQPG